VVLLLLLLMFLGGVFRLDGWGRWRYLCVFPGAWGFGGGGSELVVGFGGVDLMKGGGKVEEGVGWCGMVWDGVGSCGK